MREQILKDAQMISELAFVNRDVIELKERSVAMAATIKKSVGAKQLNWFGKYSPHKDIELLTGYKHFGHFVKETDKPGFVYYIDERDKPLWIDKFEENPHCEYGLVTQSYFEYADGIITVYVFNGECVLRKIIKICIDGEGKLDYYIDANINLYDKSICFFKWIYNYVHENHVEILELKYSKSYLQANNWIVINGKPKEFQELEIK